MRKQLLFGLLALALGALGVAAYSLGVLARGAPELHGSELEQPPAVGDIQLEGHANASVRLDDYAGRYLLVFFGYTNCPDVCPLTMSRLATTFRALGEPDEVQVVMVTVDPERDRPSVIDTYARRFHPSFDGLSGTGEQVAAAAGRFYIGHRDVGEGHVIHGSQVLLVDREGRFRRVYNDEAQRYLEQDLRTLIAGGAG